MIKKPTSLASHDFTPASPRLEKCLKRCRQEGRAALVNFITAGDPDEATSLEIAHQIIQSGTDIVELGMPFSDPMADGPVIQAAGNRALQAGQTLQKTLAMAANLRKSFPQTPLILMGYYNPIYSMGVAKFIQASLAAGVDGLIVVDLPPEEDEELCLPAKAAGLHFIRLTAPTSDEKRLPALVGNASGFLYYISVLGITGSVAAKETQIADAVTRLRQFSDLPIAIGFGIKTVQDAARVAAHADAVVIGSALIDVIKENLDSDNRPQKTLLAAVGDKVSLWAGAMRRLPTP